MTRRMQTTRTRTAWGVVGSAVLVAALTGCSSSSSGAQALRSIAPSDAASLAAAGDPSTSPSAAATPGATATASGGATATRGTSYLEQSAKGTCKPEVFRTNASLARGAFETYVAKPAAAGSLDPALARRATVFAAAHLRTAASAVKTCRTTKSLHSVTLQTAGLLDTTAPALRLGSAQQRVDASTALILDVVAQADRLKLPTTPKAPPVAQLG